MSTDQPQFSNDQLRMAFEFVDGTGEHVFLTGKAGTGKTTFLRNLRELTHKRLIVTAPTGVAAINAGGVTLHSFFQLPFGPQWLPEKSPGQGAARVPDMNRFSREKIKIIRSLDVLVIDEISMVRADLLDAVDRVLRRYKRRNTPFGGVQLLLIGDLQQLPPVVREDEWQMLRERYESPFFFSSRALQQTKVVTIELQHIFRQRDEVFVRLLNQIREGRPDAQTIERLNRRYLPHFDPDTEEGYIVLTTHTQQAHRINEQKLKAIDAPASRFEAEVSGIFPEYAYPTEAVLELKPGAQVLFARNDISRDKRYYNGKMGTIVSIEADTVTVQCGDEPDIVVQPVEWHNYTYEIDPDTEAIRENLIGAFTQIPLKLAWAITIHKSQGLTFDRAIIDANAAFAHGQVYVALSRCRTLEGLVLRSAIDPNKLRIDAHIRQFLTQAATTTPNDQSLQAAKRSYERALLHDLFDFYPVRYRLDHLGKRVREHEGSFDAGLLPLCKVATDAFRTQVQEVSHRFVAQIDRLLNAHPDPQTHPELQERLQKSSAYFGKAITDSLSNLLENRVLDCDNKALRKVLVEEFEKLEDVYRYTLDCLTSIENGFETTAYLRSRALAALEREKPQSRTATPPPPSHLLDALRKWREQKATDENVSVYRVLPQKVLNELIATLPDSTAELKQIRGMGAQRIQRYGHELLMILNQYAPTSRQRIHF
jgi:hypothetical protein